MLKKRLIPLLLLKNRRLVKSVQFQNHKDVGDPVKSAAVFSDQLADELMIINIEPHLGVKPLLEIIDQLSENCFMPLTVGGGITTFDEGVELIKRGADKLFMNQLCFSCPKVVARLVNHLGSQAVVAGIDLQFCSDSNQYWLCQSVKGLQSVQSIQSLQSAQCSSQEPGTLQHGERQDWKAHIQHLHDLGVGEILIQSVERDGTMQGYDIKMINTLSNHINVPFLALGGAGDYEHIKAVFEKTSASGAVCGSLFNFSDSNPIRARAYLMNYGIPLKKV